MTKDEELCTALLVIELDESLSSSYRFCRFIDREFHIFDCVGIIDDLATREYVTYVVEHGVEVFSLTQKGKHFLLENRSRVIRVLKREFPNAIEFSDTFSED